MSRGTITSKMKQINVYTDNVVITARSKKAMEELLKALNEKANEVGLNNGQEKTKYLETNAKRSNIIRNINVNMGQHNFERVQTFSFLRSTINDNNIYSNEILTRIKKGNKAFFRNKKSAFIKAH
jgi:hypothetical protein